VRLDLRALSAWQTTLQETDEGGLGQTGHVGFRAAAAVGSTMARATRPATHGTHRVRPTWRYAHGAECCIRDRLAPTCADLRRLGDRDSVRCACHDDKVERELCTFHARGREVWPGVELDVATFSALAANHLDDGAFDDVHADDLYLAIAAIIDRGFTTMLAKCQWYGRAHHSVEPQSPAQASIDPFAVNGCPSGWFCFYKDINFNGRKLQFFDCSLDGVMQYFAIYGFGNQTSSWLVNDTIFG
jgi:hypothetical protein